MTTQNNPNAPLHDHSKVTVRFFEERDLDPYCDYFFRSPQGYLESIGIDTKAVGTEKDMRTRILAQMAESREKRQSLPIGTVLANSRVVGVHPLTHFVFGETATMHAHFFKSEDRGRGIGVISYVKAMDLFFRELQLQEILFKTPLTNQAPLRIKEKLGIPCLGDVDFESPIVINGRLKARLYRVVPADLGPMKARMSESPLKGVECGD